MARTMIAALALLSAMWCVAFAATHVGANIGYPICAGLSAALAAMLMTPSNA